jgi:hypothetical protein
MPRKKREAKRRRYVFDSSVRAAGLNLDAWRRYWGGDTEARAAWQALRDRWPSRPGRRPPMFWAYEDVPEELRHEPPRPDPRVVLEGLPDTHPRMRAFEAATRKVRLFERKRLGWLLTDGRSHLAPGEAEGIVERLDKGPKDSAQKEQLVSSTGQNV